MIRKALAGFGGVRRRFTRTGEWNGVTDHRRLRPPSGGDRRRAQGGARIDQGPGDRRGAAASLYAAHALFEQFCTCFNDADAVIVAQVYPAGEAPIEGADRDALVQGCATHGHRQVVPLDSPRGARRARRAWRSPATMSSASAPARSRNGPMRCRGNWRRLELDGAMSNEPDVCAIGSAVSPSRISACCGRSSQDAATMSATIMRASSASMPKLLAPDL